ncbi:hypothetical protein MGH68_15850 [Erysipelothrix sp. D19-032]
MYTAVDKEFIFIYKQDAIDPVEPVKPVEPTKPTEVVKPSSQPQQSKHYQIRVGIII